MAKKQLSPEQIILIADNLMTGFIPKDKEAREFSFHFTIENVNYRADYKQYAADSKKPDWKLVQFKVLG